MATYSVNAAKTITGGETALFTMPSFSVPSGETFKRLKITIVGGDYTGYTLRGDSANYNWNTWSTDTEHVHWNGGTSKVWVSSGTTRSVRVQITFETEVAERHKVYDFESMSILTGGVRVQAKNQPEEGFLAGKTVTLVTTIQGNWEITSLIVKRKNGSTQVTVTNNKFVMPAYDVEVVVTYQEAPTTINKVVTPAGAGTITAPASAYRGTTVTPSKTTNAGYVFDHWELTGNINGINSSTGVFTVSAITGLAAVTLKAVYLKKSTATLNKTTLTGGENATLTITPGNSSYTHKYKLSFGTGMETDVTDVPAGTTALSILIPKSWAEEIPNALTKSGGSLRLWTYNGSTELGYMDMTGLTYQVPEDAVPSIGDIVTSIARTVGGVNYWRWDIGDYYIQGHTGVRIQAEAEGTYLATVASMTAKVRGYNGDHTGSAADDEIDFTSGLLTIAGTAVIEVTATDSRGRTSTKTAQITVTPYTPPAGTLKVQRADSNGDPDDVGQYGIYEKTNQFTNIGTNALTISIGSKGLSGTPSEDSGNLIPGNRLTYELQSEHTVTLTLADAFETTVITATMRSAKFILHFAADGDRIAFFKAVSKTVPSGKTSLIEMDAGTQVYIGNEKLEDLMVMTEAQSLGNTAKQQARTNIGAAAAADMAAINKSEDIGTFSNLAAFTTKIDALVGAAPSGSFISAGYIVWSNAAQNIGLPFSGHVFILYRGANHNYIAVIVVDNNQTGVAFLTRVNGTWKTSWKKITAS